MYEFSYETMCERDALVSFTSSCPMCHRTQKLLKKQDDHVSVRNWCSFAQLQLNTQTDAHMRSGCLAGRAPHEVVRTYHAISFDMVPNDTAFCVLPPFTITPAIVCEWNKSSDWKDQLPVVPGTPVPMAAGEAPSSFAPKAKAVVQPTAPVVLAQPIAAARLGAAIPPPDSQVPPPKVAQLPLLLPTSKARDDLPGDPFSSSVVAKSELLPGTAASLGVWINPNTWGSRLPKPPPPPNRSCSSGGAKGTAADRVPPPPLPDRTRRSRSPARESRRFF